MRAAAFLGGVLAAVLTTTASARPAATADEVAAAERAFAALALEVGVAESFRTYAAPDGVVFSPDPVNARADLAGKPSPKGPPFLKWWPVWAGVAASGDLGFTTGPATWDDKPLGYYFTVWKRQADGSWKWALDHGSGPTRGAQPGPDTPLSRLPATAARSNSADAAYAEAQAADARLNAGLARDGAEAFARAVDDDTRVMGLGAPLTAGREAVAAALAARPSGMTAAPIGGGASLAGDLAYTYGDARWPAGDGPGRGHYVRVWQKRADGWRLIFDEVVAVRLPG